MNSGNAKRQASWVNGRAFGVDWRRQPHVASRSSAFRAVISHGKQRFGPTKPAAVVGLAIIGVIGSSCLDIDMGIGFVLASHMQGTLVDKDMRPVSKIRVERTWEWPLNGRTGADVSVTDDNGHFEFPKVTRFSLLGILPVEPNVQLRITAPGPKGSVVLFEIIRKEYSSRSELNTGRPINIVCNLDGEEGISVGGYWGTVVEMR